MCFGERERDIAEDARDVRDRAATAHEATPGHAKLREAPPRYATLREVGRENGSTKLDAVGPASRRRTRSMTRMRRRSSMRR